MKLTALNNHQRRIFRLAFGVTVSSAVAIGLAWPMAYLAPVLVTTILGASDQAPGFKQSAALVLIIFLGLSSGLVFSALFIGQPVLASVLLTVIFFWIYYFANRELLPRFAALMLILGMSAIPLMSQIDTALANSFAQGFLVAALVALLFSYLSYQCFPQLPEPVLSECEAPVIIKSPAQCRRIASISTLVVMPAIILFLTYNLVSSALIIAFIAILSLNPALDQGTKAGIGLLLGNALGGVVAIVFYNLMKITPHYAFYITLMASFALFMAQKVHSDHKAAVLWGMALSTLLILTGSIFTSEGDDAQGKFSTRLFQIGAAAVYIIMAFRMTAALWPKQPAVTSPALADSGDSLPN